MVTPFVHWSFEFINLAIMPLWFGLLFFPRKRWVAVAIDAFLLTGATLFLINLLPGLRDLVPVLLKPTLDNVRGLLITPEGTLGTWTHFVMADLWVGRWISADGFQQGISRVWIVPILVLTLLFGPCGLLAYFLLKLALKRKFGTA